MNKLITFTLFFILPFFALAEGQSATNNQTSASLNLTIVIPNVLEIQSHYHPTTTRVGENEETIQIFHNLKKLCVTIELTSNDPTWTLSTTSSNWVVTKQGDHYTLCIFVRGQTELKLIHYFTEIGHPWPVRLTINPV